MATMLGTFIMRQGRPGCARPCLYLLAAALWPPLLMRFCAFKPVFFLICLLYPLLIFSVKWPRRFFRAALLLISCLSLLRTTLPLLPAMEILKAEDAVLHDRARIERILHRRHDKGRVAAVIAFSGGLRAYFLSDERLLRHALLEASFRFARPETASNPGGFDQRNWLESEGVFLEALPLSQVSFHGEAGFMSTWRERMRSDLSGGMEAVLDEETRRLLPALILGDSSALTQELKMRFRLAGLPQLLSVSGLHALFLSGMIENKLFRRRFPRPLREILALSLCLLWYWLSQGQIGMLRAILLRVSRLLFHALGLRKDAGNHFAFAVLLMILYRPYAALRPTFIFSLAANATLSFPTDRSVSRLQTVFPRLSRRMAVFLSRQLRLQLAFLFFSLYENGSVSLMSILAAIPALLLFRCIFHLSLFMAFVSLCLPQSMFIIVSVARLLSFLLTATRSMVHFISDTPELLVSRAGPGLLPLLVLFMALVLSPVLFRLFPGRAAAWRRVLLLFLALVSILSALFNIFHREPCELIFLSVGQGDAAVFRGDRFAMIIDGGTPERCWDSLLPLMMARGIDRFDLALITHCHRDHAGGIYELLRLGRVRTLLLSESFCREAREMEEAVISPREIIRLAEASGVTLIFVAENDTISINGGSVLLQVLLPERNENFSGGNPNEDCLVFKWESAGLRVLFTADLTPAGERALLEKEGFDADILKVAHHGSASVSGRSFLRGCGAEAAVISYGRNHYGHPSRAVLDRIADSGCRLFRTREDGAVLLRQQGEGDWLLMGWKSGERHLLRAKPKQENRGE